MGEYQVVEIEEDRLRGLVELSFKTLKVTSILSLFVQVGSRLNVDLWRMVRCESGRSLSVIGIPSFAEWTVKKALVRYYY